MKVHRFYAPDLELAHDFWINDEKIVHQWLNVLRFRQGQQLVLFDGTKHDRLYTIMVATKDGIHLQLVTDFERLTPAKDVYLFWSLLKKDKNEWVLQKCTELGVNHFVPIFAERNDVKDVRSAKQDRWQKIIIEAAEQCGRSNIPNLREPMKLVTALEDYPDVQFLVCQQGSEPDKWQMTNDKSIGLLIGPEGGWSDGEKELFKQKEIKHLNISQFTLRAETAAIAATALLTSEANNEL